MMVIHHLEEITTVAVTLVVIIHRQGEITTVAVMLVVIIRRQLGGIRLIRHQDVLRHQQEEELQRIIEDTTIVHRPEEIIIVVVMFDAIILRLMLEEVALLLEEPHRAVIELTRVKHRQQSVRLHLKEHITDVHHLLHREVTILLVGLRVVVLTVRVLRAEEVRRVAVVGVQVVAAGREDS